MRELLLTILYAFAGRNYMQEQTVKRNLAHIQIELHCNRMQYIGKLRAALERCSRLYLDYTIEGAALQKEIEILTKQTDMNGQRFFIWEN